MDCQTIERVKNGLKDPAIGPETVALMLTGFCNFNCIYCRGSRPQNGNSRSEEMTTRELFGLLEDARAFGVREINLGGMNGEPFCRQDIMEIVRKIKELGFLGSMTTNGSFLNAQAASELDSCGWDILLLSLDSPQAGLQYTLRPALNKEAYFDKIIEFLETLKSRKSKLRVLLNMVITQLNYRMLPQMADFAGAYDNIESINILKLIDMGLPTYNELKLGENELRDFQSIVNVLKDKRKINYAANWGVAPETESSPRFSSKASQCFTNYYILSIDANGDLLQCPQYQKGIAGLNIKNVPLRRLWKEEHLRFRRSLAEHAPCFEGCCTILKEQNGLISASLSQAPDPAGRAK